MHRSYIWGWACCWLININTYSILLIIRWAPLSLCVHKMLNTIATTDALVISKWVVCQNDKNSTWVLSKISWYKMDSNTEWII